MKKHFLLFLVTLCTLSLSAQVKQGIWGGKDKRGTYEVMVGPETKGGVVFEIETTYMKARGKFTEGGKVLTFKNSDGILHMRRLKSEDQFRNKKGYLQFSSIRGTVSYKIEKGTLALPGWDEGVAAVVINHEER